MKSTIFGFSPEKQWRIEGWGCTGVARQFTHLGTLTPRSYVTSLKRRKEKGFLSSCGCFNNEMQWSCSHARYSQLATSETRNKMRRSVKHRKRSFLSGHLLLWTSQLDFSYFRPYSSTVPPLWPLRHNIIRSRPDCCPFGESGTSITPLLIVVCWYNITCQALGTAKREGDNGKYEGGLGWKIDRWDFRSTTANRTKNSPWRFARSSKEILNVKLED